MVDSNICIRGAIRPDGYEYYEILRIYFDDIMIFSHLGDDVAIQIGDFYKIKEGIKCPPMWCLGAYTEKIQTEYGC